ncbi:hypothetical protein SAMN05444162_0016 [Paenibacillaceae bacterium GAS479]|nr:hypothetical protein SAMN05444162_0016 [Paenibacillaceae bacterium GAS479]
MPHLLDRQICQGNLVYTQKKLPRFPFFRNYSSLLASKYLPDFAIVDAAGMVKRVNSVFRGE